MTDVESANIGAVKQLQEALDLQRSYLANYEQPSEIVAYETLRTIDDLFVRELMEPDRLVDDRERMFRRLSTWGVNHALRRVIPKTAAPHPFRDFPSIDSHQLQADDFLFNCAALEIGERLEGWLRDGIMSGELRPYPGADRHVMKHVLVLRSLMPSSYDEEIGQAGLRWVSDLKVGEDSSLERSLEAQHLEFEPELERLVDLVDGWRMRYSSTRAIDDYFLEWARLYLRRIFSQDMIDPDDMIGGRPFRRYVEVVTALSARSQKHLAFAAILKARHPSVHLRNLLTSYSGRAFFIDSLARYMDADRQEIETILTSFILSGDNLETHTRGGATAWAPIVQASTETLMLPIYGLDINPFLFLFTDLRFRHESDWFRIANGREQRWIGELERLFNEPRWQTYGRSLPLRENGRTVTDIDFALFEPRTNELALFQLKWQQPIGLDNRLRRSAGKNLFEESTHWIDSVLGWVKKHGADELMRRLNFSTGAVASIHLFVLGRYHLHVSGFEDRDPRAVWSDWAHFRRALVDAPKSAPISQIARIVESELAQSRAAKRGESIMLPVGNVAIVLNPTSEPEDGEAT